MNRAGVDKIPLKHGPSSLIGSEALPLGGEAIRSHNPARPDETVWLGGDSLEHVDRAVAAAVDAQAQWARAPREERFAALRVYQELAKERAEEMAQLIALEVGKPLWEARQEAALLAAKVDGTLSEAPDAALHRVTGYETAISDTRIGRCVFRPHGVMAVLGPFNFPAHLPNGHIVPALALGNAIVFKPSDKTPAVGQLLGEILIEALDRAGAPTGLVNVLQGGADVAQRLITHAGVDGILFTGSWVVGRKILEANLDTPARIVALELGGNNPAIVMDDANLEQAVIECARAAFATTGQRCTCTRRIIVHEQVADRFIPALCKAASALIVGEQFAEHPVFMGPIIREESQKAAVNFAQSLARSGGSVLVEPTAPDDIPGGERGHFVTPGVVRVAGFSTASSIEQDAGCDIEVFGPVVRVSTARSLDEAIDQANATRYGLAASIFTKNEDNVAAFLAQARAGCVNVNTGTAGASGKLPFGGLGLSGNHRPAGAFALDYCAYPVASLIERAESAPLSPGMTFHSDWL